jgi:hypothetical protein
MERRSLHPGLEARLAALATRIAELKQKLNHAEGIARVETAGAVEHLERRYEYLEDRLRALDREGSGVRQDVMAEFEKLADDLGGMVESFVTWVDSGADLVERPKMPKKSKGMHTMD